MITLTYLGVVICGLVVYAGGFMLGYMIACLMAIQAHEDDMRGTR